MAMVAGKLTKWATRNSNAIPIAPPRIIFTTGDCKSVFFFAGDCSCTAGVSGGVKGRAVHPGVCIELPGHPCANCVVLTGGHVSHVAGVLPLLLTGPGGVLVSGTRTARSMP